MPIESSVGSFLSAAYLQGVKCADISLKQTFCVRAAAGD
jgi:hypothetical protein